MFKEFYGEFYRILDACADSAYQALFSAYEKEPGVEARYRQEFLFCPSLNLPLSPCQPITAMPGSVTLDTQLLNLSLQCSYDHSNRILVLLYMYTNLCRSIKIMLF